MTDAHAHVRGVLRVIHGEALAVLEPATGIHRLSERVRFTRTSYIEVPAAWRARSAEALQAQVGALLQTLYDERNRQTREAQPDDPNYLALVEHSATVIDPAELTDAALAAAFHLVEVDEAGVAHRVPFAQRKRFAASLR